MQDRPYAYRPPDERLEDRVVLGLYPLNYLHKLKLIPDSKGLLRYTSITDRRGRPVKDSSGAYSPIMIAQYTLACLDALHAIRSGIPPPQVLPQGLDLKEMEVRLRNHLGWIIGSAEETGDGVVWRIPFDFSPLGYDCRKGWVSALCQGQMISVLLRVHQMFGMEEAMELAVSALAPFRRDVEDGGVRWVDSHGHHWYEEFACRRRSQPLNGFVFSLIGLWDMARYTDSEEARKMLERGIETLRFHARDYDLNLLIFRWTRYDRKYQIVPKSWYHRIHISQMLWLYEVSGDATFRTHACRWEGYISRYSRRRDHLEILLVGIARLIKRLRIV